MLRHARVARAARAARAAALAGVVLLTNINCVTRALGGAPVFASLLIVCINLPVWVGGFFPKKTCVSKRPPSARYVLVRASR